MAIRIAQVASEVLTDALGTPIHIGQVAAEVYTVTPPSAQIGQVAVEVFRSFGCSRIPAPLPTSTTRYIRRMRRTPHLSEKQLRLFHASLQLDLQTGMGTLGLEPQITLRWSNNGGKTWSNEHLVSAGRLGQYTKRAIWRRLGFARDRVYEVTVSDPVAWRILDAYLTVQAGES